MPKLFGTDGIRARAGEFPLQPAPLFALGQALGEMFTKRSNNLRVVFGRDTRKSGQWIEAAVAAGLRSVGAEIVSAGVIPTPGIAYLTKQFDLGVVISASHNPFEDNGIKLFLPSGAKLDEKDEEELEKKILSVDWTANDGYPTVELLSQLAEDYFNFLHDKIAAGLNLQGFRLLVDCANGAATDFAPRLFAKLGADVKKIGCEPNGENINKDCGSLHVGKMHSAVTKIDLGIAFDGDADRVLLIDQDASVVDGDRMLYVIAKHYLLNQQLDPKVVVATVMSNIGFEIKLKELGIELRRTDVGDKYVLDELIKSEAMLGGEQSGHIIFPKISLAGDGIITALQILRVLVERGQDLKSFTSEFKTYPQLLVNIKVKEKIPFDAIPGVTETLKRLERQNEGRARILLRYSGTEKLARVMVEGADMEGITKQAEELSKLIEAGIGV